MSNFRFSYFSFVDAHIPKWHGENTHRNIKDYEIGRIVVSLLPPIKGCLDGAVDSAEQVTISTASELDRRDLFIPHFLGSFFPFDNIKCDYWTRGLAVAVGR